MSVSTVGVIGAGFMGSGIAESAAAAQKGVIVFEPDPRAQERSRENLRASVATAIERGKTLRSGGA